MIVGYEHVVWRWRRRRGMRRRRREVGGVRHAGPLFFFPRLLAGNCSALSISCSGRAAKRFIGAERAGDAAPALMADSGFGGTVAQRGLRDDEVVGVEGGQRRVLDQQDVVGVEGEADVGADLGAGGQRLVEREVEVADVDLVLAVGPVDDPVAAGVGAVELEDVRTAAAGEQVVADAAVEMVDRRAADQTVVAVVAEEVIAAEAAEDVVVGVAAVRSSLPFWPARRSRPSPPLMLSLPVWPNRRSAPLSPRMRSPWSPP